jgi:hypothetical protein
MEAMGVVEAFDGSEQIAPGLFFGCVDAMMHSFGLERVEEAFHRRINPSTGQIEPAFEEILD